MTYAELMMNTADGEPDKDNSAKKAEEDDSEKAYKAGSDHYDYGGFMKKASVAYGYDNDEPPDMDVLKRYNWVDIDPIKRKKK